MGKRSREEEEVEVDVEMEKEKRTAQQKRQQRWQINGLSEGNVANRFIWNSIHKHIEQRRVARCRDGADWKINMEKHKWQHAGQVSNGGMGQPSHTTQPHPHHNSPTPLTPTLCAENAIAMETEKAVNHQHHTHSRSQRNVDRQSGRIDMHSRGHNNRSKQDLR